MMNDEFWMGWFYAFGICIIFMVGIFLREDEQIVLDKELFFCSEKIEFSKEDGGDTCVQYSMKGMKK